MVDHDAPSDQIVPGFGGVHSTDIGLILALIGTLLRRQPSKPPRTFEKLAA